MSALFRLFVYGTLLPGESNAALLHGARRIGPALTVAAYDLIDCGVYPAMRAGGRTNVRGELFLVDEGRLARLDEYEGHPTLFERQTIALAGGGSAVAYLVPAGTRRMPGRIIPKGDWRQHRQSHQESR
ncbi:MAG TPA: gamma-glutamylcyclotransferase family protein [Polyangia bacterium]